MLDLGGPLLLVGAGKMGSSMLEGWLDDGLRPASVVVLDPAPPPEARALLEARDIALNPPGFAEPAVAVVAVKPQILDDALRNLAGSLGPGTLVLSVVAGKTIASFKAGLPRVSAVVRSIPNTPAAVRRGITVAFASAGTGEEQVATADRLLRAAGQVEWVEDEGLIDAATAVSGSGPAYVFLLAECLAAAGAAAGLPPGMAARLARATVEGSGELLFRSPLSPETLRRNVTSPNGTTAAALAVLMAPDGLGRLLDQAVAAAAKRASELAG